MESDCMNMNILSNDILHMFGHIIGALSYRYEVRKKKIEACGKKISIIKGEHVRNSCSIATSLCFHLTSCNLFDEICIQ